MPTVLRSGSRSLLRRSCRRESTRGGSVYGIHPVTFSNWTRTFKENGSMAFGGGGKLPETQDAFTRGVRMMGPKDVEMAGWLVSSDDSASTKDRLLFRLGQNRKRP